MGISTQPQMGFDLSRLVTVTTDLNDLIAPILQEEIDRVIKLLVDKAPKSVGILSRLISLSSVSISLMAA
jgi:hypothetical protein